MLAVWSSSIQQYTPLDWPQAYLLTPLRNSRIVARCISGGEHGGLMFVRGTK